MSLILPSFELIPGKFNVGSLFAQIPMDGSADLTVTRGSNATRFNASGNVQVMGSGIPRLDYYTSGGVTGCPALLVEPAATNGILNSADTRTNWTLGGSLTSGAIDVIGVSGNNITVAASGSGIAFAAGRYTRGANGVALASGSTYTISFFLKQTGTHTIAAYYAVIGGQDLSSGFNVSGSFSSGSIYNPNNATNRIRRVERFGTDVFRCSETFTMTASATLTNFHFAPVESVTSANNSAVGTTMGFAAPQIELGSVPTSFIPTTAGTGSRSADVISVSGAVSGSIGQTAGTAYLEIVAVSGTNSGRVLSLTESGAPTNNRIAFTIDASNHRLEVIVRSSGSITNGSIGSSAATLLVNGVNKIAYAYDGVAGSNALAINGSVVATNSQTLAFTQALSRVNVAILESDLTVATNQRIRAVALYTTRLTNAQLEFLTSPYTSYSQMATTLSYTIL